MIFSTPSRKKALLLVFLILFPLRASAATLGSFVRGCRAAEALQNGKSLTELEDVAGAFYCRGFIEGVYFGMQSNLKLNEEKCSSTHVDTDMLLRVVLDAYEKEESSQLKEAQPPEWFLEKVYAGYCGEKTR